MKQLTLFQEGNIEEPSKSDKPALSKWSYSRRGVLEQCPRKYYYQYYGSNLNMAKDDPQKKDLRFLKKLQNRHLRSGDILHFVIRWYLKKLQEKKQLSLEGLLRWALNIYRKDIKYSQQYKHGSSLLDDFRDPKLLQEFYYKLSDAQSLCIEVEERLIMALTNFIESHNFAQFREGASNPSALIEETVHLKNDYFTLSGKVDLVYWINDKVMIIDWKIGGSGSSDDSLQMLAYALWAKQKFELPPDSITLQMVHLADNTVSTFSVCEKKLNRAEARILQDLERMQAVDKYGIQGVGEAFTPCAQPKVCEMCQFQEVCPKE